MPRLYVCLCMYESDLGARVLNVLNLQNLDNSKVSLCTFPLQFLNRNNNKTPSVDINLRNVGPHCLSRLAVNFEMFVIAHANYSY